MRCMSRSTAACSARKWGRGRLSDKLHDRIVGPQCIVQLPPARQCLDVRVTFDDQRDVVAECQSCAGRIDLLLLHPTSCPMVLAAADARASPAGAVFVKAPVVLLPLAPLGRGAAGRR